MDKNIIRGAGTASGTDTYAVSLSVFDTAYQANGLYLITFTNANTVTAPTLTVNSIGAKTIKLHDGSALAVGDIVAGGSYLLEYDGTDFLILTTTGNPSILGAWTDQAYNSGDYTADGGATWTVDAGDVNTNRYLINGKTIFWEVDLTLTSISVATPNGLSIKIPNSKLSKNQVTGLTLGYLKTSANGNELVYGQIGSSGTTINFFRTGNPGPQYPIETNTINLSFSAVFEIN